MEFIPIENYKLLCYSSELFIKLYHQLNRRSFFLNQKISKSFDGFLYRYINLLNYNLDLELLSVSYDLLLYK
jgi:hypothetical protein